jgi:hypothetical protein
VEVEVEVEVEVRKPCIGNVRPVALQVGAILQFESLEGYPSY